jgi:hypothetical protein
LPEGTLPLRARREETQQGQAVVAMKKLEIWLLFLLWLCDKDIVDVQTRIKFNTFTWTYDLHNHSHLLSVLFYSSSSLLQRMTKTHSPTNSPRQSPTQSPTTSLNQALTRSPTPQASPTPGPGTPSEAHCQQPQCTICVFESFRKCDTGIALWSNSSWSPNRSSGRWESPMPPPSAGTLTPLKRLLFASAQVCFGV